MWWGVWMWQHRKAKMLLPKRTSGDWRVKMAAIAYIDHYLGSKSLSKATETKYFLISFNCRLATSVWLWKHLAKAPFRPRPCCLAAATPYLYKFSLTASAPVYRIEIDPSKLLIFSLLVSAEKLRRDLFEMYFTGRPMIYGADLSICDK